MAEEIRISASLQQDITEGLFAIEQRMRSTGDAAEDMGSAAQRGGREFAAGMERAEEAAQDAGGASRRARPPVKELGDEAAKTGAKARAGASGVDRFARSAKRAGRAAGGFHGTLRMLKFAGVTSGVFALAGGLSALAAGAVIAVGALAPMVGVVAGIIPLYAGAALAMAAFKLAATQLEQPLTRIKNQFVELGPTIAGGGLRSGLDFLADSLGGLSKVTGKGLAGIGGEIGAAARETGKWVRSAPFLNQVSLIFAGLRPIVANLAKSVLSLARAFLNILQGALPMAQDMAETIVMITGAFAAWTGEMLASGRMTAWLNKSWEIFRRVVGVVVDLIIGTFNIFRIGAGYAGQFGGSIERAAYSFRTWTGTAEGQARINQYFLDSLPALREMGKLLGGIVVGFGKLATSQNVAPLLAQIRTEFAPALGELLTKLSGQDGLGPARISAATAFLKLAASMDFGGITALVQALGGVINALAWLAANVPGVNILFGTLLTTMLAFKLLGPVFKIVAAGAAAYSWVSVAMSGVAGLSAAQLAFAASVRWLGTAFSAVGGVIMTVIRAIGAAFMANPIFFAIAAIIGLIVLLWTKCQWFRDAVVAVWDAIASAAVMVWNAIVGAATTVWNALVTGWNAAISAIGEILGWLWSNIFEPIWSGIVAVVSTAWSIISGIVQTAIYVIVAIITFAAMTIKGVWDLIAQAAALVWQAISAGASWLWVTILQPIFTTIGSFISGVWTGITTAVNFAWQTISNGASSVWAFIQPIFGAIGSFISGVWDGIVGAAQTAWGVVKGIWETASGFLGKIWDGLKKAGTAVWDAISSAAKVVADVVKGVWDGISGAIKGVWNFIAKGWNAIPSISVPEWVPLIGGKTFGLPKLPLLWHGGEAPHGKAIVGEHGPEPLIRNGQFAGMVGLNGPEIADIPRGGYVVPNLATLNALPGLAKTLPAGVAAAVSRSVPGYADVLGPARGGGDSGLRAAVDKLSGALASQPPAVHVSGGGDVHGEVMRAWRTLRHEDEARGRYNYTAGRG